MCLWTVIVSDLFNLITPFIPILQQNCLLYKKRESRKLSLVPHFFSRFRCPVPDLTALFSPQKELFASKDGGGAEGRERKMSNSSGGSMKTKWMKAFKSLKTSDPSSGK